MSEPDAPWRSEIAGLLLHPTQPRVLLLPGEAGWAPPQLSLDRPVWSSNVEPVNLELGRLLGAELTTLHYISASADEQARQIGGICVLERHGGAWTPPAGSLWVGSAELAELRLARPEQRQPIAILLTEAEGGPVPELRTPWARPGWFAEAAGWIQAELKRLGRPPSGPVVQVRSWGLSCMLRTPTAAGDVYFKVANSRPLFAHEPELMQALARLFPDNIPAPLSIDVPRRWMLLDDFGKPVGWDAPPDVQADMLRCYSQLQRATVERAEELLGLGCLDRRLDRLAAQIDPLFADDGILARQLNAEEIARLRALAPQLKDRCAELAGYAVPSALVHGDLHLDNVARPAGSFLFFDWTDACLAHPFFDTISIFQSDNQAAEERLRDSYLAAWADYEPRERLLEAWALARPLCALHQAVSYQHIVANVEQSARSETASGITYWLRKLLDWMS